MTTQSVFIDTAEGITLVSEGEGGHIRGATPLELRLRELLKGLVEAESGPCEFDHHGYCQAHGWFGVPGECYTRLAREAVGL